ncbi:MAG: SRPBCC family protein [Nitrospiria bacterium]
MMRSLIRLIVWLMGLGLVVLIGSHWVFSPQYTVAAEVVIQMAPERVWAHVGDLSRWPSWVKGLERFDVVPGTGQGGVTANARIYTGFQGIDLVVRVVESLPDLRLRYEIHGGPQNGVTSTIELHPGQDGRSTRVRWSESQTPPGLWGNLKAAGLKSLVTTHHEESLNQLKFTLERAI